MFLRLRKSKPVARRVVLGANDRDPDGNEIPDTAPWIVVRPATQFEVDRVAALVGIQLAGLVAGSEAASALAGILGDDFVVDGLADQPKLQAASARLSEINLVMACQDGWGRIQTEDGSAIAAPDEASIALLLNEPEIRARVLAVVNARIHEETAEGNVLPASPDGEAGAPATAPSAAPATIRVR
ncbi:MAG: hypothetical protein AB7S93_20805 [Xanthobacteraceae bacterium]